MTTTTSTTSSTRRTKRTSSRNCESSSTRFGPRTLVSETRPHFGRHLRRLRRDLDAESTRHRHVDHHHDDVDHDDDRSAPTTTTTSTLASATCSASDFSGVFNEGEGAAGTIYASVTLTKTTPGSCSVKGWPLLTLQDKLGGLVAVTPIDVPKAGNGFQFLTGTASDLTSAANHAPSALSLTQNQSVTFALAYSDVTVGTQACGSGVSMSVQFATDGSTVGLTPPSPIQPCDNGQIWLSPFYAAS